MKIVAIIVMLLVGVGPFFVLAGTTIKDIRETKRKIKKNEEEIRDMRERM